MRKSILFAALAGLGLVGGVVRAQTPAPPPMGLVALPEEELYRDAAPNSRAADEDARAKKRAKRGVVVIEEDASEVDSREQRGRARDRGDTRTYRPTPDEAKAVRSETERYGAPPFDPPPPARNDRGAKPPLGLVAVPVGENPPPKPAAAATSGAQRKAEARPASTGETPYDPFGKLEDDLRTLEGKPPADAVRARSTAEAAPPRIFADPDMAVGALEANEGGRNLRDGSAMGLSACLGLGLAVPSDPRGGFTTGFAYGGHVTWNPAFAGPFAADFSFYRTTRSDGTPFVSVDSAWNHFALRGLYLRDLKKGTYLGAGGGLLLTMSQATYVVADPQPVESSGSILRPGLDASIVAGFHVKGLDVRLDLRTLVRGGFRLDFLPTLAFGIAL